MGDNAYMKEYMLHRYHQRREQAIVVLGGVCVHCGSTDQLEFDHIDPSTKKFTIAEGWSRKHEEVWEEIRKCQLLCRSCHAQKSITDRGNLPAKGTHGTLSSYRYCRCQECVKAKQDYNRNYKRKPKKTMPS